MTDLPWRSSHFKAFGRSAAHGFLARTTEFKPTTAMQLGTAVDGIIFGTRKVIVYPGPVRRGKEFDKFAADNPDAEILLQADYDRQKGMVDAIRANPDAMRLLSGVRQETIMFEYNGFKCRSTPDSRGPDFLTELKTSVSAHPDEFKWQALKLGYFPQMWMQNIACGSIGIDIKDHFIVCVESKPPYPVTIFKLGESALEMGAKQLALWSERAKASEAAKVWPGYSQAIVDLEAPADDVPLIFGDDETEAA